MSEFVKVCYSLPFVVIFIAAFITLDGYIHTRTITTNWFVVPSLSSSAGIQMFMCCIQMKIENTQTEQSIGNSNLLSLSFLKFHSKKKIVGLCCLNLKLLKVWREGLSWMYIRNYNQSANMMKILYVCRCKIIQHL